MKYKDGYEVVIQEPARYETNIFGRYITDRYFKLDQEGTLLVYPGYACDGITGLSTRANWIKRIFRSSIKKILRGAIAHDVLRQCQRSNKLSRTKLINSMIDEVLFDYCKRDGSGWFLMKLIRLAMKTKAAKQAGNPKNSRPIKEAP